MPLRITLTFLLVILPFSGVFSQNISVAQFVASTKLSGINWYYSAEIESLKLQDEISSASDINSVTELLDKANLTLIKYTSSQYIIVKSEQARTSIKDWRDIKQADRDLLLATNNATAATKILGSKGAPLHQGLASVKGIIREVTSGKPAVGATIQVLQTPKGTVTDVNGAYELY